MIRSQDQTSRLNLGLTALPCVCCLHAVRVEDDKFATTLKGFMRTLQSAAVELSSECGVCLQFSFEIILLL